MTRTRTKYNSLKKHCPKCNEFRLFYSNEYEHCRSCHLRMKRNSDPEVNPFIEKRCCKCDEVKSISEFSTSRGNLRSYCKKCHNAINAEYKRNHKLNKLDRAIILVYDCFGDPNIYTEEASVIAKDHFNSLVVKLRQLAIDH